MKELGACEAIIKSIKTTTDGGFDITLSLSADESVIVNELIKLFGINEKLIRVGFVSGE